MMYATYSEGFRVGGSNPLKPASILPRIYTSDTLENYELGAKTEWLDNRLRFNFSVYSMDWKDFAVQIEDPQSGGVDENGVEIPEVFQLGYVNLPSAQIQGFESEFTFIVNDAWQVDATLGTTTRKYPKRRYWRSRTTSAGYSRFRLPRGPGCRSRPTGPPRSASSGVRAASS